MTGKVLNDAELNQIYRVVGGVRV